MRRWQRWQADVCVGGGRSGDPGSRLFCMAPNFGGKTENLACVLCPRGNDYEDRSTTWRVSYDENIKDTRYYYANVAHLFYPRSTSLSRGLLLNKCTLKYAVCAQHTTFTTSHHQVFFLRWTMEAMPRDEGNMKPMHFDDRHNIWHGIR